jgi:hypothetical protein
MFLMTVIVAALLALIYFVTGGLKLAETRLSLEMGEHLGIARGMSKAVGLLEVSAATGLLVGLAIWPLGVAAGCGLVLLMIGAVITHVRAGDKARQIGPPVVLCLLAAAEILLRMANDL